MTDTQKAFLSRAQWSLIVLVAAVSAGGAMYRLVVRGRLEQTAVLFIGIPAVLAIAIAMTPKAKTAKGAIVKGLTIALLLSGPLLGEGFVCIVIAAPIFYLVGLIIGACIDWSRKKPYTTIAGLLVVLLPMSIEGALPRLSFNREETVQASRTVDASVEEVTRAIGRGPRTDTPLPLYLRMGFPRPTHTSGSGLQVGATRTVHFAGGEGKPGDLVLRVEQARPGYVRFGAVSDSSKLAHWLDWRFSEVEWTAVDAHRTRVTWTIHFARRLDPAWYFRPWERYATTLAARYLIAANAIPTPLERGK